MAKKKTKNDKPVQGKTFPVTLHEFSVSIKKPETRGGFVFCIKDAGLNKQKRTKDEWQIFLDAYNKKPAGVQFADWIATTGK